MRNCWLIFIATVLFVGGIQAIWIGEEYWSIINYDGSIYGGRSVNDFIRFKGSEDRFVAYWITHHAPVVAPAAPIVTDECYNLNHDTNGDGIVDSREHHECRYGKLGCPISIYDANKDGLLDSDEINECLKHLKLGPYQIRNRRDTPNINLGNDNQFEAYGEAYIRGDRICAKFVDKDDRATEVCGGFRVLSRGSHDNANPFEWYPIREISRHHAVEYLSHQIAQVWNGDRLESAFGGAHMDRQLAYAAFPNNTVLHVSRNSDAHFYDTNIDLLALKDGYFPKQYIHTGPDRPRRYGTVFTPDDLISYLRRPSVAVPVVTDECYNLVHDTNGDGIVDSREHHTCRYGKLGCPISIYDANKDGLLDSDEINECIKHLQLGPYALRSSRTSSPSSSSDECLNLRHDRNGDGYISRDELHACRYGINTCNLGTYDSNNDGFLDFHELRECERHLTPERRVRFAPSHHRHHHHQEECNHLRHDINKDGKIDRHELHVCRYGLANCNLQSYDLDKDGYLNAHEITECKNHLIHQKQQQHRVPEQEYTNNNDCHNLRFDKNGDGIIDNQELHACRYNLIGCNLEIYDLDKDGYLNAHETSECYKHLKTDRFVRYCQDLYFDLNKDGRVDTYELEKCLNQHDPIRRRFTRSHGSAEEQEIVEEHNEVQEITEDQVQDENEEEVKKEFIQKQEEEIEEKQQEILEEKKQEIQELNEEVKEEAEKKNNKSAEEEENDDDE